MSGDVRAQQLSFGLDTDSNFWGLIAVLMPHNEIGSVTGDYLYEFCNKSRLHILS